MSSLIFMQDHTVYVSFPNSCISLLSIRMNAINAIVKVQKGTCKIPFFFKSCLNPVSKSSFMTQTDFGTKESRQNSSKNQVIEKLNDDKPTAAFSHGAKSFTIEDFNRIPPPPPIQAFCENTRIFLRLGLRVSIKNHLLLAIRKTSLAINVPPIKTYKINFARIFRRRVVKNIENFKTEL